MNWIYASTADAFAVAMLRPLPFFLSNGDDRHRPTRRRPATAARPR